MISELINKLPFIRSLNIENRKKAAVYFYCLLISIVFWFLVVFTKEYTSIVIFPVKYANLPKDKVVAEELPKKISVELKASGFNLLGFKLSAPEEPLIIDVKNLERSADDDDFYYETQRSIDHVSRQIKYNVKVVRILPEIINISFKPKSYKKVPVKLKALFGYKPQYQLSGNVVVQPSSIVVSGESSRLDSIKYIETESLNLNNLDHYTEKVVRLKVPENNEFITLSAPAVKVKIPVEKYTEASVEVPVNVMNLPPHTSIKTFPDKIKVTFLVSLSNYQKVSAEMFTITADYEVTKKEKSNKLKLNLTTHPSIARNVRLDTDKVEFILKKL